MEVFLMSEIVLPQIYQQHMMLQRNKTLKIRGQALSGSRITIVLDETRVTVPILDGHFSCDFPPQDAGWDKTLSFYLDDAAAPELVLRDILIGDLWMACGQSNMEYFLRYDANWNETKQLPHNSNIRMYNVPRLAYAGQQKPQEECGYWFEEGDPAWPLFSAPGYSFARNLQTDLQIPIGIIGCNWGGTPACAWMGEQWLTQEPFTVFQEEYEAEVAKYSAEELEALSMEALAFEDSYRHQLEWRAVMYGLTAEEQQLWLKEHQGDPALPMGPWHHYRPSGLYHTMIETVAPLSITGFLWYQGESDSGHAEIYDQTMAALIDCFRKTWQDETLPFLFVQLAPFGHWLECGNENYAIVRNRQERAAQTVPGAYMTSIMDLGSYEDIHPKFKMEVGRRLALLAKGHVYGLEGLFDSPEFASASRTGNQVRLTFRHTGAEAPDEKEHSDTERKPGLVCDAVPAEGFTVTQSGQLLPVVSCQVMNNSVLLTLDSPTGAPLHISYAEKDYCTTHIWNAAGLSLKPFHCEV
jgi:sialate O-acetylesterase